MQEKSMSQKYKIGQLLFSVRVADESNKLNQHITIYLDAGYLCEDGGVRALDNSLIDYCEMGFYDEAPWFESKNEAIDYTILELQRIKD